MRYLPLRLLPLVVVISLALPAKTPSTTTPPSQPNIIFLVIDDLDLTTMQAALHSGLMPNFQQYIVEPGTTFTNAFVNDPRGCPVRESYWTGLSFLHLQPGNQTQCGISLFNDSDTIGVWMKRAGYTTSVIGKTFDGCCYTDANHDGQVTWADTAYIPPGWDNWQGLQYDQPWYTPGGPPAGVVTLGQDNPNEYQYFINNNGVLQYYPTQYQGDTLNQMAAGFVTNASKRTNPYFLYLATGAPHIETNTVTRNPPYYQGWTYICRYAPWFIAPPSAPPSSIYTSNPNFNEADVSDKPSWIRQKPLLSNATNDFANLQNQFTSRVYALASTVDPMVGNIMNAMTPEQAANTIWIVTSDNGWQLGNHRLTGKLDAYEESIRVPLYVSAGGGVSSNAMILPVDLPSTIVDLAGASIPYLADGKSFRPLLYNPALPWRNRFLVTHATAQGAASPFDMPDYQAVRTSLTAAGTPNELWVEWATGEREFYDLTLDPAELTSIHTAAGPGRRKQMQKLHTDIQHLYNCGIGQCLAFEFAQ